VAHGVVARDDVVEVVVLQKKPVSKRKGKDIEKTHSKTVDACEVRLVWLVERARRGDTTRNWPSDFSSTLFPKPGITLANCELGFAPRLEKWCSAVATGDIEWLGFRSRWWKQVKL
jgi:hypothetical protein